MVQASVLVPLAQYADGESGSDHFLGKQEPTVPKTCSGGCILGSVRRDVLYASFLWTIYTKQVMFDLFPFVLSCFELI